MTYELGLETLRSGDLQGALKLFDQAIQSPTTPDLAPIYCQRAQLRARLGDNFGAIADYSQSLSLAPSAPAYLGRAIVQFGLQGHRVAILDAQQALTLDGSLAPAHELIGKAHGSRNPAQAIEAYRQAAQLYLAQGDANRARTCLTQATEYRAAQRRPEPGFGPSSGSNPGPALLAVPVPPDFLAEAIAKLDRQTYGEALSDLTWLLGCDPTNAEVLAWRSIAQAQLNRDQGAIDDMAQAIALAPDSPTIRKRRIEMRLILGDGRGAIADCDSLLSDYPTPIVEAAYPDYAALLVLRGQAALVLGDIDSAFKDFCNGIAMVPSLGAILAPAHEGRGQAQRQSDPKAAIVDYQTAARHWLDQGNLARHRQALAAAAELSRGQDQLRQAEADRNSRRSRVPIETRNQGVPVVRVQVNGQAIAMLLDRGARVSVLCGHDARQLGLQPEGSLWGQVSEDRYIELPTVRLRSIQLGALDLGDAWVTIAPNADQSVIGQDLLAGYEVSILDQEIELVRRE
jgi:tetratricopeptide (TPR) repeat protein